MMDAATAPLTRLERWGIYLLLVVVLLWGCLVEQRSAFLDRRMGDGGVYLQAGYAALCGGGNLYTITDDNGWHYIYPPFFALLLTPLADPPAGCLADVLAHASAGDLGYRPEYVPMSGPVFLVPYEVSIGLWYLFSLACLIWATHRLAGALEERADDPALPAQPRYCRRWWSLRILPVLICLLPIGHTLQRSQVNLLILALLCAMMASFIRRQSFRAGLWLSIACAIKVIPLFLVLYPVLKRDGRCLKGWCLGMAITIVAVPMLAWGPQTTVTVYKNYFQTLLGPAFHIVDNHLLDDELLGAGARDNQSLKSAFYNLLNPQIPDNPVRANPRPGWETPVWVAVGLLLTGLTVAAGWKSGLRSSSSLGLFLGSLLFLMSVLSPVCHLHYFAYSMPLVMALLLERWQFRRDLRIDRPLLILFGVFILANLVPHIVEHIRDVGLPLWAGLCLWLLAVRRLWTSRDRQGAADRGQLPTAAAGYLGVGATPSRVTRKGSGVI